MSLDLSIIIPVYNCGEYLETGLKSLQPLWNSDVNFEIIYVNDGSTDNSAVILNGFTALYNEVKVIHQENQGSSGARNAAIDVAQGEYLCFLDSDDILDIQPLLALLKKAQTQRLDALSYRLDYIDEAGNVLGERSAQPVPHNVVMTGQEALVHGFNPSSICLFLFRNEFLQTNQFRIYPKITHMDVEFTSRVFMKIERLMFVDQIIYHYLQRPGSITKPKSKEKKEQLMRDEITVAIQVKENLAFAHNEAVKIAIQKNYNSIIWSLLFQFYNKRKEIDPTFIQQCIASCQTNDLYPIKGPLKTKFQHYTRYFFNTRIFRTMIQ